MLKRQSHSDDHACANQIGSMTIFGTYSATGADLKGMRARSEKSRNVPGHDFPLWRSDIAAGHRMESWAPTGSDLQGMVCQSFGGSLTVEDRIMDWRLSCRNDRIMEPKQPNNLNTEWPMPSTYELRHQWLQKGLWGGFRAGNYLPNGGYSPVRQFRMRGTKRISPWTAGLLPLGNS